MIVDLKLTVIQKYSYRRFNMSAFVIDISKVKFEDQDGNILIEGSLLDINYEVAELARAAREEGLTNAETYDKVATLFQAKFQSNGADKLSWPTAMKIATEVQKQVGAEKKD